MYSASCFPSVKPIFKRISLFLKTDGSDGREPIVSPTPAQAVQPKSDIIPKETPRYDTECTALVLNSSHQMAKEIGFSLTLKMPNCSIMYAPSIQLARWILMRRKVDLVVSSAVLADGSITALLSLFSKMDPKPDLVVVGHLSIRTAESLERSGYHFTSLRHCGEFSKIKGTNPSEIAHGLTKKVKELGADIRNDLNNPLQEIVAMAFVARAGGGAAAPTVQALEAIDRAAKGMATKIKGLEDRIREAVL